MNRRLVLAVVVLVLVAGLLLPDFDIPPTHLYGELEDAAHGPLFGFVALCALAFLRAGPAPDRYLGLRGYGLAWLIATVLGGLGELAQLPGPRDASWGDFRNDAIGAACALLAWACVDPALRPLAPRRRRLFAGASFVLVVVLFAPLAWTVAAYEQRQLQLPVLFDPGAWPGRMFVHPGGSEVRYVTEADGRVVLEARLQPGPDYPGIELSEPWPDWRGRSALVIEVENPGDVPQPFNLHIRDAAHDFSFYDRYNSHQLLAPRSAQTIRIPIAALESAPRHRRMDVSRMSAIVMFGDRTDRPAAFRIRDVRLE